VHEHQVVPAVGEPGQHVQGLPHDQPVARRRKPGFGERLPGGALMLGFDVDGGQHSVGSHSTEQAQPAGSRAGTDLDHSPGTERAGQESQRGATARPDRGAAQFQRPLARRGQYLVFGDETVHVVAHCAVSRPHVAQRSAGACAAQAAPRR
jgi:hypothetical protein